MRRPWGRPRRAGRCSAEIRGYRPLAGPCAPAAADGTSAPVPGPVPVAATPPPPRIGRGRPLRPRWLHRLTTPLTVRSIAFRAVVAMFVRGGDELDRITLGVGAVPYE